MRPALGGDAELLGPAPRFRRRGRFRRRLLIKSAAPERDVAAVRAALGRPEVEAPRCAGSRSRSTSIPSDGSPPARP